MAKRSSKRASAELTGETFDALPDAEKERFYQEIDADPERLWRRSKRPAAKEQARLDRVASKIRRGRPRTGRATKVISVSVESGLLADADAYAKRRGLRRSELVVQGLRLALRQ